jgi:hypothetical protein
MTEITELPWCRHGINKSGYCADCKVSSLITTIESQKEEIEKWREFGKVTVQWYKDNDWPIKAVDVQAILDWISYTPTLCEIEKQAEHWQEG